MQPPKYYTGIGSRETPKEICELMTKIAKKMAVIDLGYPETPAEWEEIDVK